MPLTKATYSVIDGAPINVLDFGAVGDGVANDAAAIQAAIDAASAAGGALVWFPSGNYFCGTTELLLKPNIILEGEGYLGTVLEWSASHTGNGIRHAGNRNFTPSLVRACTEVRDLSLKCTNGSNTSGGGYVDESGVFISLYRVLIDGFGYCAILDQSELAEIDQCIFQSSNTACIWVVNGPARIPGTDFFYTNRISVTRCQLDNGLTQKPLVIDDGGYAHSYIDNNYSGGSYHIRAAGVSALKIDGGEFEGNFGQPQIILTNFTAAGVAVGGCVGVAIKSGLYLAADNRSCIKIEAGAGVEISNNYLSTTGPLKIDGAENASSFNVIGNEINGAGNLVGSTQLDYSVTLVNGSNNDIPIPYYGGNFGGIQFVSVEGPTLAYDITGFVAGVNGQCILVYNNTVVTATIKVNSSSSAANNRINTSTGIDYTMVSGASAMFVYRESVGRWIQALNA